MKKTILAAAVSTLIAIPFFAYASNSFFITNHGKNSESLTITKAVYGSLYKGDTNHDASSETKITSKYTIAARTPLVGAFYAEKVNANNKRAPATVYFTLQKSNGNRICEFKATDGTVIKYYKTLPKNTDERHQANRPGCDVYSVANGNTIVVHEAGGNGGIWNKIPH